MFMFSSVTSSTPGRDSSLNLKTWGLWKKIVWMRQNFDKKCIACSPLVHVCGVCACVDIWVLVYGDGEACACGDPRFTLAVFHLHLTPWSSSLSWTQSWSIRQSSQPACSGNPQNSPFGHWNYKVACNADPSFTGVLGPNSGLYTREASTSPVEPSPRPEKCAFLKNFYFIYLLYYY